MMDDKFHDDQIPVLLSEAVIVLAQKGVNAEGRACETKLLT